MRKWFRLYLTFSAVVVASTLALLLYVISHIMSRTPPTFGGNASLILSLAWLVPFQASNFAKRRIKKIAAEGAREKTPRWARVIDRIVTAFVVLYFTILIFLLVLAFKGWFAP